MSTCIVKTPSLLGQTRYFVPRNRHNTILREYQSTLGRPALSTNKQVPSRGMLYTGTTIPSSRWASHPELPSESWLGRRHDRGAAM